MAFDLKMKHTVSRFTHNHPLLETERDNTTKPFNQHNPMNKKVLLSIASLAVATILTGGLTSCSGDDGSYVPTPTVTDKDGNKMQVTNLSGLRFAYDESGKLLSISDGVTNVATQDGKLVFDFDGDNASAYINSDGLLTKIEFSYRDDEYSCKGNAEFNYSDRRLKSCSASETGTGKNYSYKVTGKANYTWKDGNLTQVTTISTESGKEDGESFSEKTTVNYNFNYGNQINYTKQLPFYIGSAITPGEEIGGVFSVIGLYGYGPAYLPTGYTEVDDEGKSTYTLSFTQNSNGTINSEKRNNSSTVIYGYNYIKSRADNIDIKSLEQCIRSLSSHFRHRKQ